MIRFGLCCIFKKYPIKFRRTTATHLSKLSKHDQLKRLSDICLENSLNLQAALEYCHRNQIGDFRINSQILPLKSHPVVGYEVKDLNDGEQIIKNFKACGHFCRKNNIRTTFHPDQFIVLSSPNPEVVQRSVLDLNYQAQVAQWVKSDVINIHGGGVYGDKPSALDRLRHQIDMLPDAVRDRLTIENDDRSYSPEDLIPLCQDMGIPLVYDVHHHRCLTDSLTIQKASELAVKTWNREPVFHISSPIHGWGKTDIRKHHDYIHINDFPDVWLDYDLTVEVEAKAKELAVFKLMEELKKRAEPQRGSA